jgi:hypothetical protein
MLIQSERVEREREREIDSRKYKVLLSIFKEVI